MKRTENFKKKIIQTSFFLLLLKFSNYTLEFATSINGREWPAHHRRRCQLRCRENKANLDLCIKNQLFYRVKFFFVKCEALNQRELVTYFNLFLVRTCTFMNNFSTQCESKLAKLHARLDTIDTSITLLETKVTFHFRSLNSQSFFYQLKLTNS
jgi:hypothetical protein